MLLAKDAGIVSGRWVVKTDPTAAGGARLQSTNVGAAKVTPALASPAHYFEMTFAAEAGRPYHLWLRGQAESNNWANDSVHVQFDGTVDAGGVEVFRIGTAWQRPRSISRTAAVAGCRAGAGRTTATA